jgi:DNA replication protein DnaD
MKEDVKIKLHGQETVTLSGQTVEKLIRAGDGEAALLYLYILMTRGQSTSTGAAAALGKTPGGIATAMAVLSRLGLVELDGTKQEQEDGSSALDKADEPFPALPEAAPRRHSVEDIKRELEAGSVFYALVEEAQRSLGKILSPDELLRLFGIYDSLQMAPEVILQLITHCISESRGRNGGRMPSIRYIEKAAYTWEREGIFTLDKAEEYLKALDAKRSAQGEIKKVLQIREYELSETQRRFVDGWIAMGFGADAVGIAYDRTIVKTGRLAWEYIDTIMKNWHAKGIHTKRDIIENDGYAYKKSMKCGANTHDKKAISPSQEDTERMERLLNKIKEENEKEE